MSGMSGMKGMSGSNDSNVSNGWTAVCRVQDIPVLGARRVARPQGLPVAVFRNSADEVFALLDRCPHKAGPLSQGIVSGRQVACPLHNWNIGLDDGCAKGADSGCTPSFACKVEDGQVYLDRTELADKALDLSPPLAGPRLSPSPSQGEGRGRSGGFEPHAASPLSDAGLQAGMRTASEGGISTMR